MTFDEFVESYFLEYNSTGKYKMISEELLREKYNLYLQEKRDKNIDMLWSEPQRKELKRYSVKNKIKKLLGPCLKP